MKMRIDRDTATYESSDRILRAYDAIIKRTARIKATIPPARNDCLHDRTTARKDRAVEKAMKLHFEKARDDVLRLYRASLFLMQFYDKLRIQGESGWRFIDEDPTADAASGRPAMPDHVKLTLTDMADELYKGAEQLFWLCHNFLLACCLKTKWLDSREPNDFSFEYPAELMLMHGNNKDLRKTSRDDIKEKCAKQQEDFNAFVALAHKYAAVRS